jgi:Holliday junction DNA helicase RuvA
MIGMLRGIVWKIDSEKIVLDVGGVGYLLHVPAGRFADVKQGEEKVFHTHLLVRTDDFILYGFSNPEEKNFFIKLLGVTGIGPKAALSILSAFPIKKVKIAILREDFSLLTEVPGIGKKTAKRLILELKDKVRDIDLEYNDNEEATNSGFPDEALDILLALGFSRMEAREALNKATTKGVLTTEEQVKEALRFLATPKGLS